MGKFPRETVEETASAYALEPYGSLPKWNRLVSSEFRLRGPEVFELTYYGNILVLEEDGVICLCDT